MLAAAALGGSFTKRRKTGLLLSGGVRNVLYMVDSLDLLRKEEKENPLFSVKKKVTKKVTHINAYTWSLHVFLLP